ncbi:hypothetical protein [Streptosporangium longisporum]
MRHRFVAVPAAVVAFSVVSRALPGPAVVAAVLVGWGTRRRGR